MQSVVAFVVVSFDFVYLYCCIGYCRIEEKDAVSLFCITLVGSSIDTMEVVCTLLAGFYFAFSSEKGKEERKKTAAI